MVTGLTGPASARRYRASATLAFRAAQTARCSAGPGMPARRRWRGSAASSGARDVDGVKDRTFNAEHGCDLHKLRRTGILAAQVPVQRRQCLRLTDPVTKAHQVGDRARWIVDPDMFAGCGLDPGQAELESGRFEPERGRRRV